MSNNNRKIKIISYQILQWLTLLSSLLLVVVSPKPLNIGLFLVVLGTKLIRRLSNKETWAGHERNTEHSSGLAGKQSPRKYSIAAIVGFITFFIFTIFIGFMFVSFLIDWFNNPDINAAPLVFILIAMLLLHLFLIIRPLRKFLAPKN